MCHQWLMRWWGRSVLALNFSRYHTVYYCIRGVPCCSHFAHWKILQSSRCSRIDNVSSCPCVDCCFSGRLIEHIFGNSAWVVCCWLPVCACCCYYYYYFISRGKYWWIMIGIYLMFFAGFPSSSWTSDPANRLIIAIMPSCCVGNRSEISATPRVGDLRPDNHRTEYITFNRIQSIDLWLGGLQPAAAAWSTRLERDSGSCVADVETDYRRADESCTSDCLWEVADGQQISVTSNS